MLNLSVPIDCTRVYLVILLVVNESGCYASCTLTVLFAIVNVVFIYFLWRLHTFSCLCCCYMNADFGCQ